MEFNERLKKISERNRQVTHVKGKTWPIAKRLEVVHQYLALGNMKMVSALTDVPYDLLRKWKTQPWWDEMVREIRATQNIEMDTKLSDIVQKTLDAVNDRIVNGDYVYDQKTGEIKRRPAALRDIHRVAVDLLAKREFLRDKVESKGEHQSGSVEDHLKLLADRMGQWFEDKKRPVIELNSEDVTDVTEKDQDAVHDEWEEGLQEGEQEVQLSSGECGEEGPEEPSEETSDGCGPSPER